MVVNATYHTISAISLKLLLVESLEKTINLQKLTDKHYHTMLYRVHCCIEYTVVSSTLAMYIWYLNTMWKGLNNFVSYAMAIAKLHVDDILMLMMSALYYINIVSLL